MEEILAIWNHEDEQGSETAVDIDHPWSMSTTEEELGHTAEAKYGVPTPLDIDHSISTPAPPSSRDDEGDIHSASTETSRYRPTAEDDSCIRNKVSSGKDPYSLQLINNISMRRVPWFVHLIKVRDEESKVFKEGDQVFLAKASTKGFKKKYTGRRKGGVVTIHRVHPGKIELKDKKGVIFKVELESPEEEVQALWTLHVPPWVKKSS